MLLRLFEGHAEVRHQLLDAILARLVTAHEAARRFAALLAELAARQPQPLLALSGKVHEALDDLPQMAPPLAAAFLEALQGLLVMNPPLLDYSVLVLRKALFHRDAAPRLVATQGFLFLLRTIARPGVAGNAVELGFEILGLSLLLPSR